MGCINMWVKKCKYCGKKFNVVSYGEEYCPYCGAVLDKEEREEIREKTYTKYYYYKLLGIVILSIALFIVFLCVLGNLSS